MKRGVRSYVLRQGRTTPAQQRALDELFSVYGIPYRQALLEPRARPLVLEIGSGMGILNPWQVQLVRDAVTLPVIVDAGVGTASDAAIAMELGCDGVLMNTAIAAARDPVLMAGAMRKAVEAGREAFLAGRMPKKLYSAAPSSPTEGKIAPKAA